MTHGKTYNKSPRRINHKTTKSKTNTGTTALERSVEQKKGKRKVQGAPQPQTAAPPLPPVLLPPPLPPPPPQTPRGRGNRQTQISTNRTNARKAPRPALPSPSEATATLKGPKNTRTKRHTERHTTNRLVE